MVKLDYRLKSREGAYFAYLLPAELPFVHPSRKEEVKETFARVAARMEKLEEALDITGLSGETFSEYVKVLFDSQFDRFEEMRSDDLANYALLVHRDGYEAQKRLDWPNTLVVVDTAFTTMKEWETIRHIGVGGSDGAVIQNAGAFHTKYQLYHDKVMTPELIPADEDKQAIFDRGHAVEPKVIEAFCKLVGAERIPETRMFRSKTNPYSLADIDAVIRFPATGAIYFFEAKSTVTDNFKAWANDRVPVHYIPQTRQYPAVMNDPRIRGVYIGCIFVYDYALHGFYIDSDYDVNRFVSRYIERDEEEEKSLLDAETEFFEDHVLAGQVPLFEGPPDTDIKSLRTFIGHADEDSEIIKLDDVLLDNIQGYLELQKKKSVVDAQSSAIKEAMQAMSLPLIETLGQAIEGRMPIPESPEGLYWEVKYAPRRKVSVDFDILEHKYPEAYAECVDDNPDAFRVLSIREKDPAKVKKKK